MADFDIENTRAIDASGNDAGRTVNVRIYASPTLPADDYTVEYFCYDDYGDEVSLADPHTYAEAGGSAALLLHYRFDRAELTPLLADRYEREIYVRVTTLNSGWLFNGITLYDSAYAEPTISASLSLSEHLTVSGAEYGVQTKTKAVVDLSGSTAGQFAITGYGAYFDTQSPSSCTVVGSTVTTAAIAEYGTKGVVCRVYAGKKWFYSSAGTVEVLPYSEPSVVKPSGESAVICTRCAQDGTYSNTGTYLHVGCEKNYSSLTVGGTDRNSAEIEACISYNGGSYGAWFTVSGTSDPDAADYVSSAALFSDLSLPYSVKLRITDLFSSRTAIFRIPAANIPLHLAAGGRAVGIGQYASQSVDRIDLGWTVRLNAGLSEKVVYSGASKAAGSTISSASGDFSHIENFRLFIINDDILAMKKNASSAGFSTYPPTGTTA